MNVAFRVDASEDIGIGHVMRCLTLANALKSNGAVTRFICRQLPEYLCNKLIDMGHDVVRLVASDRVPIDSRLEHAEWLGVNVGFDAQESIKFLKDKNWCWLIVDHYAIDEVWETELRSIASHIMVIDDLADRSHDCDLLLDQTLGRGSTIYRGLVPSHCEVLTGVEYALLRPEFSLLREYSLNRRRQPELKHLLVTMGGMDQHNVTGQVLTALSGSSLPANCKISVIMGAAAPFVKAIEKQAATMCYEVEVHTDVGNMAELMASSDLVIGAAGSTSWERCCLGVPSITVVLASNQKEVALRLQKERASIIVEDLSLLESSVFNSIALLSSEELSTLSMNARVLVDGNGVTLIIASLNDHLAR